MICLKLYRWRRLLSLFYYLRLSATDTQGGRLFCKRVVLGCVPAVHQQITGDFSHDQLSCLMFATAADMFGGIGCCCADLQQRI